VEDGEEASGYDGSSQDKATQTEDEDQTSGHKFKETRV